MIKYERLKYTLSALFLSLFITENCLSLAFTVSPRETFGAFVAFCSQGCSAFKRYMIYKTILYVPTILCSNRKQARHK